MGKKRNKEIQKVILSQMYNNVFYVVDSYGLVCAYKNKPHVVGQGWYDKSAGAFAGCVMPFKGDGWKTHIYSPTGHKLK